MIPTDPNKLFQNHVTLIPIRVQFRLCDSYLTESISSPAVAMERSDGGRSKRTATIPPRWGSRSILRGK